MTSSVSVKPSVLIVSPRVIASFIQQDRELLSEDFQVNVFAYSGPADAIRVKRHVARVDVVLIWFAGRHSPVPVWLARRLGKPIVTIVGGYEAAWIPSIGYGIRPGSLKSRVVRWVLRTSDRIAAVSSVTQEGVLRIDANVTHKLRRIYNAVNTDRFRPGSGQSRTGVLCVSTITEDTLKVKNWQRYCDIASALPDVPFSAIGLIDDYARRTLLASAPPNITWRGGVYGDQLIDAYQSASVYLQTSVHESFSLALAEAMSCGCIPVTTRGGALPEVAGHAGHYIDTNDIESAAATVRAALDLGADDRERARQRILNQFPLARRREELKRLLTEALDSRR